MLPRMSSTSEPTAHGALPLGAVGKDRTKTHRPPGRDRCSCSCGCEAWLSIYSEDDVCSACHPSRRPPCPANTPSARPTP